MKELRIVNAFRHDGVCWGYMLELDGIQRLHSAADALEIVPRAVSNEYILCGSSLVGNTISADTIMDAVDWTELNFTPVPSGTSPGMFPKTTLLENGVRYFVKTSAYTKNGGIYGIQAYSEVMASRIGRLLGVETDAVQLVHAAIYLDGHFYLTDLSKSLDFSQGRVKQSFEKILKTDMTSQAKFIGETSERREFIAKMHVFDYLINNVDRHGKNIEVFTDDKSFAPLFDHGLSLFSAVDEENIANFVMSEASKVNNFVGSAVLWENVAALDLEITLRSPHSNFFDEVFLDIPISDVRKNAIIRNFERRLNNVLETGKVHFD